MPPNVFAGQFAGDVLTVTSRAPQGQTRATFDFSVRDRYAFRMEVSGDGAKWQPIMEGSYARQ
jgi:hypothetical protein